MGWIWAISCNAFSPIYLGAIYIIREYESRNHGHRTGQATDTTPLSNPCLPTPSKWELLVVSEFHFAESQVRLSHHVLINFFDIPYGP
jgi:hypothetical protein